MLTNVLLVSREVRDGTMLKLVDSDALTPSSVRRSHSAHSSLTNDSHYFSEPEFDLESSSRKSANQYQASLRVCELIKSDSNNNLIFKNKIRLRINYGISNELNLNENKF